MHITNLLPQDTWYGKGVLSLLKHLPEDTKLERLTRPKSRLAFRINESPIIVLKRGKNQNKKKRIGFDRWHFSFSSPLIDFLNKEKVSDQQIVVLLVCPGGPIGAICWHNKVDRANITGGKTVWADVTSRNGTYSFTGSLYIGGRIRPMQTRKFWDKILKVNSGA